MAQQAEIRFEEVETWIFDLDNTLYPASSRLFDQIGARITQFICQRCGLEWEAALSLRRSYFHSYGTTLRGLMTVDGIDPEEFLAYVHEIDLSVLPPNPALERTLSTLNGRKIVHTNASARHASRILDRLGIARHFSAILDIAAAGFEPKPELAGYEELIRRHGVNPGNALMIEDIAKNLVPASTLGMATVWLRGTQGWEAGGADEAHIDCVIEDLGAFLAEAAGKQRRA